MTATGRIDGIFDGILRGWAWDEEHPSERLRVMVSVDGRVLRACRCDQPRGDLLRNRIGDGAHGFNCPLPRSIADDAPHGFALLLPSLLDTPLHAVTLQVPAQARVLQGKVERATERELVGWIWNRAEPGVPVTVELVLEGRVLASLPAARRRADLLHAGIGNGAHGFVFNLDALLDTPAPGTLLEVRTSEADGHWPVGSARYPAPARAAAPPVSPPPMPPAVPRLTSAAPPPLLHSPPEHRGLLQEGRQAEARRDFKAAAHVLDRGLTIAPADFDLLFTRARVALALRDLDTCERLSHAALRLRPGHVRPTILLARLATTQRRHEEAAALWAAVPPGDSAWRERLVKRGRSLLALGRPLDALPELLEAIRLDAADRDALRGAAEATEAAGSLRAALRRWRLLAAALPDDTTARERIAALTLALAPLEERHWSPLLNPDLRDWIGPVDGETGPGGTEPSTGLRLRAVAAGERLGFALDGAHERRPGGLPVYGLWLLVPPGGAELAFRLDPEARDDLTAGLRMVAEFQALSGPLEEAGGVEIRLGPAGAMAQDGAASWEGRRLGRFRFGRRPRMIRFDLRLTELEEAVLLRGGLALILHPPPGLTVTLKLPRPVERLPAQRVHGLCFETDGLASALATLGRSEKAWNDPPKGSAPLLDLSLPFVLLRPAADPTALPKAVTEILRETEGPFLCVATADPRLPGETLQCLRDQARRDPRLLLLPPDVPSHDAVMSAPAKDEGLA